MSSQKNNPNQIPKDKLRLALIASFGVLILVLASGLISYYSGKKESKEGTRLATPIISVKEIKETGQKIRGVSIQSFNGQIVKVENAKITLSSQIKQADGSYVKKEIVAVLSSNTELFRLDLTKPPSLQNPAPEKEKISFADFKKGQQIIVQSENGLNGNLEIAAKAINLLITPGSK